MRRWLEPSLLVLAVAMVVSVALHLPAYGVLGVLADRLLVRGVERNGPALVEFTAGDGVDLDLPEPEPEEEASPEAEAEPEPEPEAPTPEPDPERRPEKKVEQKKEEEKKEQALAELTLQKKPPPPAEKQNLQAVTQHSQNPEERPDNARFVAEENNRVEEETVARLRNYVRDDEVPTPGAPEEPSEEQEEGNADESLLADMREMEGSDERAPTPEETEVRRPEESPDTLPQVDPSEGDRRARGERVAEETPTPAERADMVAVTDGYGTLMVPRPTEERPEQEAKRARRGQSGRGLGIGRRAPNERLAYSQLAELYGRERLDQERQAYVQERRSKRRGANREQRWREFRAAIENFTPNVKPGNQTALNAAASPFATYIAAVHRRIHREYADKFLAGLPTYSSNPFSDPTLMTKLEIILNRDGTVHRVGVVKTSGFLPFDYGAFNAVMRGQPYGEAPLAILSGDGRVYFHWGFYRNGRQCGTFNAEPFILPNPPGSPPTQGGALRDRPDWGGVVPDGAAPTWGTEPEGDGDQGGGGDRPGRPRQKSPEGEPPREPPRPETPKPAPGDDGSALG